jgi:hypothetical protein
MNETNYVFTKKAIELFKQNKDQSSDKYRNLKFIGDKLYRVDGLRKRQIIPLEEIESTLTKVYGSPETGLRSFIKFWQYIKEEYEGINLKDVRDFMKNNETNQIMKPVRENSVNKPIITNKPNELIQIDLADVSDYAALNNNITFLLTAVDAFSKFAYVYPLKHKTENEVSDALDDLFKKHGPPARIQHDSGSEFKNKSVAAVCEKHGVAQVISSPYHPRSNGIVEKFNSTLKSIIHKFLVHFNTQHYLDALQKLVKNYNSQIHTTTKHKPVDVDNAGADEAGVELTQEVKQNIQDKAEKSIKDRNDDGDLVQGDYVRLAQITNAHIRKNKVFRKSYEKNWSDEIFRIAYVNEPKSAHMPYEYFILDFEKNKVLDKKFYRDQLLKIDPSKLIKTIPNDQRPDFNKKIFNRERLLKQDLPNREVVDAGVELPEQAIDERKNPENPRRNRKPNKKYANEYV